MNNIPEEPIDEPYWKYKHTRDLVPEVFASETFAEHKTQCS